MNMYDVPSEFLTLDVEDQMRVVLEIWLRLHHSDPRMVRFTHARASIDNIVDNIGTIGTIEWSLLIADDNSVSFVQPIKIGKFAYATIHKIVAHYLKQAPGASKGRLTFHFHPPSVGFDLFSDSNEPVFARHIIDLAADQRARDAMRIITH